MTDDRHEKLRSLIDAWWEGSLTQEQAAYLQDWICRDDEACRFYLDYMELNGLLVLAHAEDDPADSISVILDETSNECKCRLGSDNKKPTSPILGFLGDVFQGGADFLSRSVVFTLLAALGLPALLILILVLHLVVQPAPVAQAPPPVVAASPTAAELTQGHRCVWGDADGSLEVGAKIAFGRKLTLKQGFAELTFADGTVVLLEGPAEFNTVNGTQGFLRCGRLVAQVPKGAEGFAIETPEATVVDLGTEFGVSVDTDQTVETHVFQGKVELAVRATPGDAAPSKRRLVENESVQVLPANARRGPRIEPVDPTPEQFVRHLPKAGQKPKTLFVHRGDANPVTEGWKVRIIQDRRLLPIIPDRTIAGPVNDGEPAWMIGNFVDGREFQYAVLGNDFSRELVEAGKKKGWVLRARIKIVENGTKRESCCSVTYCDGEGRSWALFPKLMSNGNQHVSMVGKSSLDEKRGRYTVPHSKDQYVDYEIRCKPGSKDAEVYVNGKLVATGFGKPEKNRPRGVRFATARHTTKGHYAFVEWKPLDDSSDSEQGRGK
ncbi:MAG: FecR domain-containing protein [Pirellulales bacterium]|nr:FecR domain-containing protein [Pirellulales bacterium]